MNNFLSKEGKGRIFEYFPESRPVKFGILVKVISIEAVLLDEDMLKEYLPFIFKMLIIILMKLAF